VALIVRVEAKQETKKVARTEIFNWTSRHHVLEDRTLDFMHRVVRFPLVRTASLN
jgi:hypothetical protein